MDPRRWLKAGEVLYCPEEDASFTQRVMKCKQCEVRYHPANNVKYKDHDFCGFKCKDEWISDNASAEPEQLTLNF